MKSPDGTVESAKLDRWHRSATRNVRNENVDVRFSLLLISKWNQNFHAVSLDFEALTEAEKGKTVRLNEGLSLNVSLHSRPYQSAEESRKDGNIK